MTSAVVLEKRNEASMLAYKDLDAPDKMIGYACLIHEIEQEILARKPEVSSAEAFGRAHDETVQ